MAGTGAGRLARDTCPAAEFPGLLRKRGAFQGGSGPAEALTWGPDACVLLSSLPSVLSPGWSPGPLPLCSAQALSIHKREGCRAGRATRLNFPLTTRWLNAKPVFSPWFDGSSAAEIYTGYFSVGNN